MVKNLKLITVNCPESYVKAMDELIEKGMYPSRSEIIRIAVRDMLKQELWDVKPPVQKVQFSELTNK